MAGMTLTDICSTLGLQYAWKEQVRVYLERHRWTKPANKTQSLESLAQQFLTEEGDYWLGPNSTNRSKEGRKLVWPDHKFEISNLVVAMMQIQDNNRRKSYPEEFLRDENISESKTLRSDVLEDRSNTSAEISDSGSSIPQLTTSIGMTDLEGNRLRRAIKSHVLSYFTMTREPRTVLKHPQITILAKSFLDKLGDTYIPREVTGGDKLRVVSGIIEGEEELRVKKRSAATETDSQGGSRVKRRRTGVGSMGNAEILESRTHRSLSDPSQQVLPIRSPVAQAAPTTAIPSGSTQIPDQSGENIDEPAPPARTPNGDPVELTLRRRTFEVYSGSMPEVCKAFTNIITGMSYEARRRREKIDANDQDQIAREDARAEERKETERRLVEELVLHGTEVDESE